MNKGQIEIFRRKWQSGYRPGDENWSPEDQEVYEFMVALVEIANDGVLEELAEYE